MLSLERRARSRLFLLVALASALLVAGVLSLVVASSAAAAQKAWQSDPMNAIIADIAQRPATLYCTETPLEWFETMYYSNGAPAGDIPYIWGATWANDWNYWLGRPDSNIYIGYVACDSFRAVLGITLPWNPSPPVASADDFELFGVSVHVLTHEAIHKRLRSNDEGYVECMTMKMMPDVTSRLFRVPAQTSESRPVIVRYRAWARKHVRRKLVRVRVWRTRTDWQTAMIPNPNYDAIQAGSMKAHLATPPTYQGVTC
jgi:hypothetical protein